MWCPNVRYLRLPRGLRLCAVVGQFKAGLHTGTHLVLDALHNTLATRFDYYIATPDDLAGASVTAALDLAGLIPVEDLNLDLPKESLPASDLVAASMIEHVFGKLLTTLPAAQCFDLDESVRVWREKNLAPASTTHGSQNRSSKRSRPVEDEENVDDDDDAPRAGPSNYKRPRRTNSTSAPTLPLPTRRSTRIRPRVQTIGTTPESSRHEAPAVGSAAGPSQIANDTGAALRDQTIDRPIKTEPTVSAPHQDDVAVRNGQPFDINRLRACPHVGLGSYPCDDCPGLTDAEKQPFISSRLTRDYERGRDERLRSVVQARGYAYTAEALEMDLAREEGHVPNGRRGSKVRVKREREPSQVPEAQGLRRSGRVRRKPQRLH